MNYKNTCPKCGPITLPRKFNFCPKCGAIVKEAEGLKNIGLKCGKSFNIPKDVDKILDECGAKTTGEKKALLGSIQVSDKPNAISENVGGVSKVSR
jgi:ribosomal protein S27AE